MFLLRLFYKKLFLGKTGLRCNRISFNEPALCFNRYSRVRLLLRNAANVVSYRNVAGTYRSLEVVEILYVIGTYNIGIKRSFVINRLCNILYCFLIKHVFQLSRSVLKWCIDLIHSRLANKTCNSCNYAFLFILNSIGNWINATLNDYASPTNVAKPKWNYFTII